MLLKEKSITRELQLQEEDVNRKIMQQNHKIDALEEKLDQLSTTIQSLENQNEYHMQQKRKNSTLEKECIIENVS